MRVVETRYREWNRWRIVREFFELNAADPLYHTVAYIYFSNRRLPKPKKEVTT